ncbi:signal recognition particle-docking protein FtsY [Fibrobacterota bacterium]
MNVFHKVRSGLAKTREKVTREIKGTIGKGKLTEETLEDLEALLISADIRYEATSEIIGEIRKKCLGADLSSENLLRDLEKITGQILVESPPIGHKILPHVILILGVNGVGKTTSIAKLAHFYKNLGKKVLVAAGDTFRAGAIEQLEIWCQRAGVEIVKHQEKSDAAAVVFDAYSAAKSRGHDIMIVDTAGRLHNKETLMEELKKIIRVLKKHRDNLPDETLLVIDGNTGQNALPQAMAFNQVHPLDGFVVTKLDGTAKGGALISINYEMKIPVRWIGVGEKLDDLIPFSKEEYVKGIFRDEEIEIPLEQQAVRDEYKGLIS